MRRTDEVGKEGTTKMPPEVRVDRNGVQVMVQAVLAKSQDRRTLVTTPYATRMFHDAAMLEERTSQIYTSLRVWNLGPKRSL